MRIGLKNTSCFQCVSIFLWIFASEPYLKALAHTQWHPPHKRTYIALYLNSRLMKGKPFVIARAAWDGSQSHDSTLNSSLCEGTAVRLSSLSRFTALLQLSLRNCCRCFCHINLSYPPRKLSNKAIERGPQRVQSSNIKWQGSEIRLFGEGLVGGLTCFLANILWGLRTAWHVEDIIKTGVIRSCSLWNALLTGDWLTVNVSLLLFLKLCCAKLKS